MSDNLNQRIESMYQRDRTSALVFVAVLWSIVLFVLFMVLQVVDDGAVKGVLVVAAALLLTFNTASIFAMVKHYKEDKEFIYGLDIHHLDEMRKAGRS